jgi:DNA invertase Pin-like site-specific DNA recombinase
MAVIVHALYTKAFELSDLAFDGASAALYHADRESNRQPGAAQDIPRQGLVQALTFMRAGDVLVVWKLDRLGRSLKNLIDMVTELDTLGIGFRSVTESIDTTTSSGKLIFHIFGALAEFERNLIRERTQAGLTVARARGRHGGHPRVAAFRDEKEVAQAFSLYNDKNNSIADICSTFKISRATLYRYIAHHKAAHKEQKRWLRMKRNNPIPIGLFTGQIFDETTRQNICSVI